MSFLRGRRMLTRVSQVAVLTLLLVRSAFAGAEMPVELELSPRAIEQPLMKYRLLPAESELREGNAAPILLRLRWEQDHFFTEVAPTLDKLLEIPLDGEEIQTTGDVFPSYFRTALKRAAYRRDANWEYPIGEEPLADILLPDIQGAKVVERGLSVWIRHQVSQGDLNGARDGVLVGFAVSRHYARTPFMITQFVSASLHRMMLDRLEELVAQPNSPNLYWALSDLPRPLMDVRHATAMDVRFLEMTFTQLAQIDDIHDEGEWHRLNESLLPYFARDGKIDGAKVLARAQAELPAMLERGTRQVDDMSDDEVTVRWLHATHKQCMQQLAALFALEPPAAIPQIAVVDARLRALRDELGMQVHYMGEGPLNAYLSINRLQRRIDVLRAIEAIRHFAATHEGRLPERLEDIADAPVPGDPLTGRPFEYSGKDDSAILFAPRIQLSDDAPTGTGSEAIRYALTIRQSEQPGP